MVERQLLLYVIFMIWKLTQEHYVPPPNHCIMAMTCNHSGIPLCGFDKNKNCNRMFLDECDLYEYNCDSKAAKDVATTTTESMTEQITDKVDVKPEDCDFPSYCDRPKTWLTTSKGETRDFYRIIKDNEGK
ncbi:uncharacterized protein LOC121735840 [Aricia agestis]|uniref:uncharacterized protein LOC121735840 n=1 Tax=Aricia agestis TaxID=91739 RepID=UPI001C201919|nr:uncharacterized protein LOC121735840 [Aricia agestis]